MDPRTDSFKVTLANQEEESQSLNVRRYPKPGTTRDPGSYNFGATSLVFNAHFKNQAQTFPEDRNDVDPMNRYSEPDHEPCTRVFGYLTQGDVPKMRVLVQTERNHSTTLHSNDGHQRCTMGRFTQNFLPPDEWLRKHSHEGQKREALRGNTKGNTTGIRYPDLVDLVDLVEFTRSSDYYEDFEAFIHPKTNAERLTEQFSKSTRLPKKELPIVSHHITRILHGHRTLKR